MAIDLKKLKVTSLSLHQPVSLNAPLSPFKTVDERRVPGVQLTLSQNGVFMEHKEDIIFVPFQNILSVKMEKDAPTTTK